MAVGAGWMGVLMASDRLIGLVSTLILVRILVPEDFGIVAMCTSVVALLELFTAFGFDMVLINRQEAGRDHYDTAWTFGVILGVAISLLLVLAAWPAAHFYDEPRVVSPMFVLAVSVLVRSFENIAVVDFRKYMQFRRELVFNLTNRVIGFCVTISLAFVLASYWALVLGILAASITRVVVSYLMLPYLPRPTLSQRRDIMGFSIWMLLMNMTSFVRIRASDFVLGRAMGAHSLGVFQVGQEISSQPTSQLIAAVNRAVYPGYARLNQEPGQLRETFLGVMALIAMAALPVGIGIAAVSPLVVPVLLGEGWTEATMILPVLAVHGVLSALASNAHYVFYGAGLPRYATITTALQVVVLVPLLIALVLLYGLIGGAWAFVIAAALGLVPTHVYLNKTITLSVSDWLARLWRPLLASAGMWLLVTWYGGGADPTPLRLLLSMALGGVSYVVLLLLLVFATTTEDSMEQQLLRRYLLPFMARLVTGRAR